MNLFQKLLELKKAVPYLKKADKAYDYDFVSEDDVLAVVNPKMNELGLLLIPSVVPGTAKWARHEYVTSKGKPVTDILATADMVYTWIDAETGERLDVAWTMFGQQDDASQAFGSGVTYCGRYFVLKALQIATGKDDPDRWRADQKRLQDQTAGKAGQKAAEAPKTTPAPASAPATPPAAETPDVSTWSEADVRAYIFHGINDGKGGTMDYPVAKAMNLGPKGTDWLLKMAGNTKRSQTDRDVAARAAALCEAQG
jgi:hypothetical protein